MYFYGAILVDVNENEQLSITSQGEKLTEHQSHISQLYMKPAEGYYDAIFFILYFPMMEMPIFYIEIWIYCLRKLEFFQN